MPVGFDTVEPVTARKHRSVFAVAKAFNAETDTFEAVIQNFDFDKTQGCSNCKNCIITGTPQYPVAKCAKGHGKEMDLRVMFTKAGVGRTQGFRRARECPDREMMSKFVDKRRR